MHARQPAASGARRRLVTPLHVLVAANAISLTGNVPPLAVIVGALIVLGVAAGSLVPMQATVRQERSPKDLLPRVVGLSTATIPVVGPISVLIAGFLLEALGLRTTMLAMTAGTAMIGIAAVLSTGVRAFDRAPSRGTPPHDLTTPVAAVTGA